MCRVAGIGKQGACAFQLETGGQQHVVTSTILFPVGLGLDDRRTRAQLFPIYVNPFPQPRPGTDQRLMGNLDHRLLCTVRTRHQEPCSRAGELLHDPPLRRVRGHLRSEMVVFGLLLLAMCRS